MPDHVIETDGHDTNDNRAYWECDCGASGSCPIDYDVGIAAERHVKDGESVSYRYPAR